MMRTSTLIGIGVVFLSLVALMTAFALNFGQAPAQSFLDTPDAVGVIYVSGVIAAGGSGSDFLGGVTAGSDTIMEQLRQAKEDPAVKAVVIRINSPGGSAAASQEIGEEIKKVREAGKIVVASMGDTAASGGYWIAANTDCIVANPGTLTGSIGVITQLQNLEELYEKLGISYETFTSGPHKDMGSSARPITEEERQIFQAMVDDIFQQFVAVVAEGRGMTEEEVLQLADGRVFTGRQALEAGLVDELGNFHDALDLAAEMAGLGSEYQVKEFVSVTPLQRLLQSLGVSLPNLAGRILPLPSALPHRLPAVE